jgi:acetyltransferase-like isoleucine patch superfamily enzyme
MTWSLTTRVWNALIEVPGELAGSVLNVAVTRGIVHFPFASQALSLLPFSWGWKMRRAVYSRVLPSIGTDAVLHFGVTLEDPRTTIGHDVWISVNTYIDFAEIGDHVLIGPHAVLLAGGRVHRTDRTDVPIKSQGNLPKSAVKIGAGAWIGANATVMADVGRDAIVGAGSVVTRPVPPYAVVAGNPARLLRFRHENGPTLTEMGSEPAHE